MGKHFMAILLDRRNGYIQEPLASADWRARQSRYTAGRTNSVSTSADSMPPTIGAAMRRMTSEPVPLLSMIGKRAANGAMRLPGQQL